MSGKDSSADAYAKIILAVIIVIGYLWWKTDNIKVKEIKRQQEQIEMYQKQMWDMQNDVETVWVFLNSVEEEYEGESTYDDAYLALNSVQKAMEKIRSDY